MKLKNLVDKLNVVSVVPAGWRTRPQWQKEWDVSYVYAGQLLRRAQEERLCAMKKFRVPCADNVARTLPHYKFKGDA